jgi:3-hydroxyacyl-CoA dehydrogenase/enoyl-CoA hydratase/3-hydroxybutyryl-CoA epimerase
MSAIKYNKDQDNIVTLTIDSTGQSVNTMNAEFHTSLHEATAKIKAETDLAGIIITSAKKTFFAGGDLDDLIQIKPSDAQRFYEGLESLKADMRTLETLGKPVVAALNGTALGGGWEIALATHRRIALADPKTKFGLPEVTLGLLPGGGGVVRMVRLLGLQTAFPFSLT